MKELTLKGMRYSLEYENGKRAIAKRIFGERMAGSPKSDNPLSGGEIAVMFVIATLIHPVVLVIVNFSVYRWSDWVYEQFAWFAAGPIGDGRGLLATWAAIIWVAISAIGAAITGQYGEEWVRKHVHSESKLKPIDAYKKAVSKLADELDKRYDEEEAEYRRHLLEIEQKIEREKREAKYAMIQAWTEWCISKDRFKDSFEDPSREFKIAWSHLQQKGNPAMRVINSLPSLQGVA